MRSEIFNEFVKIAQEQKIISNDSKKSRQALEKNPRADSLDITAIEALYGVKPTSIPELKYKNNIMEVAHPDSLVISPAYDKINGLVENNIERQNINLRIVNKNPDGLLTQRKYAEQQFLLSLVRVANDLDNKNETKLRDLADHCLKFASNKNKIKKKGWGALGSLFSTLTNPYVIGGIVGSIYLANNLPPKDEGFELNSKNLIGLLTQLKDSSITYEYGFIIKPEFKKFINNFIFVLEDFEKKYHKHKRAFDKASGLDYDIFADAEQLATEKPADTNELLAAYDDLRNDVTKIKRACDRVSQMFSTPNFINRQIKSKGEITKFLESTRIITSDLGLLSNIFKDIVREIPVYISSLDEIMMVLGEADKKKLEAESKYTPANEVGPDLDDDKPLPSSSTQTKNKPVPQMPKVLDDEAPVKLMPSTLTDTPANENARMQAAAKFNLNNLFKK